MSEFPLLYPERVADDTIKGFLYQILWSTLCWLDLDGEGVLLCEGDEDLDSCLFENGKLIRTDQRQFKDLAQRISARSKSIYESIFNFIVSFHYHHKGGRECRFSFITTAAMAAQDTDAKVPINVLKEWIALSDPATPGDKIAQLTGAIQGIVAVYRERFSRKKDGTTDGGKQKRLDEAITYLDQFSLWERFFHSVKWSTEAPTGDELRKRIMSKLAQVEVLRGFEEQILKLFASRLVDEVLTKCSKPKPEQRTLDKEIRIRILGQTVDKLKIWAHERGQEELLKDIESIKKDVMSLREELVVINRKLPPSLEEVTNISLRQLEKRTHFQISNSTIRLRRTASDALVQWVVGGNSVIIGEPGIGKSAVLYHLAEDLLKENNDVVMLTAEKFIGGIQFIQELMRWTGEKPGFVLIDGLDAQRGARGPLYDALETLIQNGTRWRVIGSIRKFDLENDPRLQQLFKGSPHDIYRPTVGTPNDGIFRVRCFELPRLDNDELSRINTQSSALAVLLGNADFVLKDLLYNIFNLSLVAQLLTSGKTPADFTSIRTQVDLLDFYWEERVSEDPCIYRIPREALLRAICENMMQVPDLRIEETSLDRQPQLGHLEDLLHSGLVLRPEALIIEFSHNILFDYAISRYWLKAGIRSSKTTSIADDYQALCLQLEQHGDLVLLVYPSLEMFFVRLWEQDLLRQHFWQCVLTLAASPTISPVLLVAPAAVAARLACQPDDLKQLCAVLTSGSDAAHKMVQRLVTALSNLPSEEVKLAGTEGGPWCELAEWLAETSEPRLLDAARRLLLVLTPVERPRDASAGHQSFVAPLLTAQQQAAAHRASLVYIDYVTSLSVNGLRLLLPAIQLACRNVELGPASVVSRLRAILSPEALDAYGYIAVPAIARSLYWIYPHDIDFVANFYVCAFQYRDTRRDETLLSTGPVMRWQSNRQQDYDGGLYALEEQFSILLEQNAGRATWVLIAAIEAWEQRQRRRSWAIQRAVRKDTGEEEFPEEAIQAEVHEIQLGAQHVRFQSDLSAMSDGVSDHLDHETKMLDKWSEWLDAALEDEALSNRVEAVIATLFERNMLERIWMRLLRVSARHPAVLGRRLLPLASHPAVFSTCDRQEDVGVFLGSVWPELTDGERTCIESKFRVFLEQTPSSSQEWASHVVDAVLTHVHVKDAPAARPDPIPPRSRMWREMPIGRQRPASGSVPPVLYHRLARVKRWADKQDELTRAEITALPLAQIRGDLRQLHRELTSPRGESTDTRLQEDAWGYLAAVGAKLARREDVSTHSGLIEELGQFLLGAARCASPRPQRDEPLPADATISWGFPAARLDAARGLCALLWKRPENQTLSDAVTKLALYDPNSIVRWQVAYYAKHIHVYCIGTDLSAAYLSHIVDSEPSGAVVSHWMQNGVLWDVARKDIELAFKMVERILERFPPVAIEEDSGHRQKRNKIWDLAVAYYIGWAIRFSHPRILERVDEFLSQPWCQEAQRIPNLLHAEAVGGLDEPLSTEKQKVREQTWSLLERLCKAAHSQFEILAVQNPAATTTAGRQYLGVQHTLHNLARMAWHHLEANQQECLRDGDKSVRLGPLAVRQGFWTHAHPVIEILARVPIPSISEELIKALSGAIDFAPKDVLLLAAKSLSNAVPLGFATDTFAALTTSKFIRRYLVEQRPVLQRHKEARDALLQMLSPFVDMAWPELQKLVFRIADAFR